VAEQFAESLKGKQLTREQTKPLINTVLVPKLEFPPRDAPQTNKGGALVTALEQKCGRFKKTPRDWLRVSVRRTYTQTWEWEWKA